MHFDGLPDEKFNTLVIDPPWAITMAGKRSTARHQAADALPYCTLSIDDIRQFPVVRLANIGAHVYLWVTNKTMRDGFDLFDSWDVRFHLIMAMVKRSGIAPCNGYVFGSEFCLLGFAGQPMQPFLSIGRLNWLVVNPLAGTHSAKPQEFYNLVAEMSPAPRADFFARNERWGWHTWGNEVKSDEKSLFDAVEASRG